MPKNTRLTLIDILSTIEVSPEILLRRADYWTGVAIRHVRHNRVDQASRLRANIRAMKAEALRLARLQGPDVLRTPLEYVREETQDAILAEAELLQVEEKESVIPAIAAPTPARKPRTIPYNAKPQVRARMERENAEIVATPAPVPTPAKGRAPRRVTEDWTKPQVPATPAKITGTDRKVDVRKGRKGRK